VGISYPVALLAVLLGAGDLVVDDPEELGVDSGSGGARRRSGEGRKKSQAPSTAGMRTPDPRVLAARRAREAAAAAHGAQRRLEVAAIARARRFCEGEGFVSQGEWPFGPFTLSSHNAAAH
jgi:hypothetical protein